jgi:hypothetical protein
VSIKPKLHHQSQSRPMTRKKVGEGFLASFVQPLTIFVVARNGNRILIVHKPLNNQNPTEFGE